MNSIKDQLDVAWVEGNKLLDEGHKLYTDGNNLWADKVAEVCGSEANIEWTDTGCIVMGMEFKSA